MLVGYMRVSSEADRQTTDLQRDALLAAGVDARHLFEDHASGAKDDRPGLVEALAYVHPGDVLVVWKLDRLGRSLSHLLSIVNTLKEKQVAFRSLTEGMDTTTASGELGSRHESDHRVRLVRTGVERSSRYWGSDSRIGSFCVFRAPYRLVFPTFRRAAVSRTVKPEAI